MRRARSKWVIRYVVTLFFLGVLLSGCRLLDDLEETPQATVEAPDEGSQAVATTPADDETGPAPQPGSDKPEKPQVPSGPAADEAVQPTAPPAGDAARNTWTVLIYMSASEALDATAMRALDEIAGAAQAEGISVVAQLDRSVPAQVEGGWQEARRLVIERDGATGSEWQLIEDLGPTNMGDPDSLTAFVQWGQEQFPAMHTALILWGEGRGWRGLVQDAGDGDDLSLGDLSGALERASQGEGNGLDVVAFAGGMTASLEVFRAVQPFAAYAVGSPGLLPPETWDYGSLVTALVGEPQATPQRFAQLMVIAGLRQTAAERSVNTGLTAVALARLPAVETAFGEMARFLTQQADRSMATVALARISSQLMTLDGGGQESLFAAIDLGSFARYVATWSSWPQLAQHGEQVAEAMAHAVSDTSVSAEAGSGFGLAFMTPAQMEEAGYDQAAPEGWPEALRVFYEATETPVTAPQGQIAVQQGAGVGAEDPVLLGLQLRALQLQRAWLSALQAADEGGLRLLFTEPLEPEEAVDAPPGFWPDGVTQRSLTWDTTAPYVSDGATGAFAPLWRTGLDEGSAMVLARYLPPQEAGVPGDEPEVGARDVVLFFDTGTQQLTEIWQRGQEGQAARLLTPASGASLQLTDIVWEGADEMRYEPGVTLTYSDGLDIHYEMFPLPSGDYQVGILAEDAAGSEIAAAVDLTVTNEELTPGYRTYLNTAHGFQFQYPVDWPEPVFDGRQVATAARQRGPGIIVSLHPAAARLTAAGLKQETLDTFGAVDILYEEEVVAGGLSALLTAYGYDADDGPHTGVLVTFVNAEQEMGYVVDVDGLSLDEMRMLEIADHLIESWRFTPIRAGMWPTQWVTTQLGEMAVTLPPQYGHETLENGWELFKDGARFLALRADAVSGRRRQEISQHWLDVASRGVSNFVEGEERTLALGGTVWSLVNFDYEGETGPVSGVILSTIYDGQEISAWAEGSQEAIGALWNEQFIFAIAGALPLEPGGAGLMYEEPFDETGAWGVGRQDGAAGVVQDGVYEMAVDVARGFFWTAGDVNLAEGQFEVDVTQTMGPMDAGYGLLLRADGEEQSFYVFEISSDGYAWIGWCEDNCAEAMTLIGEGWLPSEAIVQGLDASNRLRVDAVGKELTFYVNDVRVGAIEDERATQGEVGLFVETLGEDGVVVQFDNLRVTAP